MITPAKAEVIVSILSGRIGLDAGEVAADPEASRFAGRTRLQAAEGRAGMQPKPYPEENGVAIISIVGTLVNRGAWIGASSGLVSYEGVRHQIAEAARDADIKAIILDIHSSGGEATGAVETAAVVREATARKRVVAVVNSMAASAAYAIASGASEIVTTETGVSGSIGIVLLHADHSEQLKKEGVKPTLIFAGAHKVDGNPFEPLPDNVRADLQAEVNKHYELFLATVEKGRGARLTAEKARAMQGRIKIGEEAVAAGLADRLGSFDSVLAELQRPPAGGRPITPQTRSQHMTHTTTTAAAPAKPKSGLTRLIDARVAKAKAQEARQTGEEAPGSAPAGRSGLSREVDKLLAQGHRPAR
ncbi:MAG: S49 family peptidase [Hyphomonas sp.]|nr:S49 family peptidase [Hyphomonas sp.]